MRGQHWVKSLESMTCDRQERDRENPKEMCGKPTKKCSNTGLLYPIIVATLLDGATHLSIYAYLFHIFVAFVHFSFNHTFVDFLL